MKNKILFLIILLCFAFYIPVGVKAEQSRFYIGERVGNLWLHKKNPIDGKLYYNSVRIIREQGTNNIAYCIEPFDLVNDKTNYEEIQKPGNISLENMKKIKMVAYFGYGYKNHVDKEWYAVTQFMIWKLAKPDVYTYLSIGLNGPPTNAFNDKIQEIEQLINNFEKNLSFNEKEYIIALGEKLTLNDKNLSSFMLKSDLNIINSKNNDEITFIGTKEGIEKIYFEKKETNYNKPAIFFYSLNDQDVVRIGNPDTITNNITIKTVKTKIILDKVDLETTKQQGEANLKNCEFDIYNENAEKIKHIKLKDSTQIELNNLPLGKYKIIETNSGDGYLINKIPYEFTITENNLEQTIKFTNQVIKGKLKIFKSFGTNNIFNPEKDISFNIYDSNNELVKTITTDNLGYAEAILPYGKYKLIQNNTTKGYKKIDPIEFSIKDETEIKYNLKNELIKGKLKIFKSFGTDNIFNPEKNISFNIYDSNNELVKTITTDNLGYAEIMLPYGKYKLTQITTTEGYKKINPIEFAIKDETEIKYDLKNYKIQVPNTGISLHNFIFKLCWKTYSYVLKLLLF